MRLSTSTNIYFNRPDGSKAPIEACVRLCAEAGYRAMDMNFHDCATFPTAFTTERWRHWVEEIRQTANDCGVQFGQAHSPFYNFCDPGFADREVYDGWIARAVECAGLLGVKWLVIHAATDFASPTPVKDSLRKNVEYFKPLLELAAKHQVGIAIENLWDLNIAPVRRYTTTAEELVTLVDALPYDNVGVCWDFEHADLMQIDQRSALTLIGDRLKATHVSDHEGMSADHILPFSGRMDWDNIMKGVRDVGYDGDFTFEIHRYTCRTPTGLVPSALKYSVEVGQYLLSMTERSG